MAKENSTTGSTFDRLLNGGTTPLGILQFKTILNDYIECHGCFGKGWIENSKGELKTCPICEGKGKLKKEKEYVEKEKEKNNLPWHWPWYPYPCDSYPTYPIITYCEIQITSDTNLSE